MSTNQKGFVYYLLLIAIALVLIGLVTWRVVVSHTKSVVQNSQSYNSVSSQQTNAQDNPVTDWASAKVFSQLPDCSGNQLLTRLPVEDGVSYDAGPLGHLAATGGHAYPSDHNYFNFNTNGSYKVLSPGNIYVTKVRRISRTVSGASSSDDSVYFMPCKQVVFYFNHVQLTDELSQSIPDTDIDPTHSCHTPVTNTSGYTINSDCYGLAQTLIALKPGDIMATATVNENQKGWDFGALDARIADLALVNPGLAGATGNWNGITSLKATCSFNYFPPAIQDQVFSKPSMVMRPSSSKCGEIAQDKLGTLQGDWYEGAHVDYADDWTKEFGIVHYNVDPAIVTLSVGGTLGSGGMISFKPKSTGTVNVEPSATTAGPLYCYMSDGNGISDYNYAKGHKILLQLTDNQTLKAEYKAGDCTSTEVFSQPITYKR